jgi:outer membrane receptor protein involved in Fe transport
LTVSLNAQNIFNQHYYTYTYSSQNPVAGIYDPNLPGGTPYGSGFVGQPRSVLLDLTARF